MVFVAKPVALLVKASVVDFPPNLVVELPVVGFEDVDQQCPCCVTGLFPKLVIFSCICAAVVVMLSSVLIVKAAGIRVVKEV